MRRYLIMVILIATQASADPLMRAYGILDEYVKAAVARKQNRGTAAHAQAVQSLVETNTRAALTELDIARRADKQRPQGTPYLTTPNGVVFLNWQRESVDEDLRLELLVVGEAKRVTHLAALRVTSPTSDTSTAWKIAVSPALIDIDPDRESIQVARPRLEARLPEVQDLIERLCFTSRTPQQRQADLQEIRRRLTDRASATLSPTPPPELRWTFNETNDSSGTNHGAIRTGGTLRFTAGPDYFDTGTRLGVEPFTISFWIKAERRDGMHGIISNRSPQGGFDIQYNTHALVPLSFRLYERADAAAGAEADMEFGKWQHVACTWNGRTAAIFVNGMEGTIESYVGADATGRPRRPQPTTSQAAVTLGRSADSADFAGELDDVRVLRRALTHDEITTLWRSGRQ